MNPTLAVILKEEYTLLGSQENAIVLIVFTTLKKSSQKAQKLNGTMFGLPLATILSRHFTFILSQQTPTERCL